MYRLEDRFTEPELVAWVDRQNEISEAMWHWFGGLGVGLVAGIVLSYALGLA